MGHTSITSLLPSQPIKERVGDKVIVSENIEKMRKEEHAIERASGSGSATQATTKRTYKEVLLEPISESSNRIYNTEVRERER